MNVIKMFLSATILVLFTLAISGCQGNNSDVSLGESSNAISNPLPDSDKNATSDIASLALNITSSQETELDLATNKQSVIVVDSTAVSIAIKAFDSEGISAREGNISVIYPHVNGKPVTYLGTMTPSSLPISSEGLAEFTYNPPKNIDELKKLGKDGVSFIFYDTAYPTHNVTMYVKFSNPKYQHYNLSIFPAKSFTITKPSQSQTIKLNLEDSTTHKPISDEAIAIDFFESSKGTMNNFTTTTDVNGYAELKYTAPENNITGLSDFNITARLVGNKSKSVFTTVKFDSTVITTSKYATYKQLKVYPDTNITINKAGQSAVIEGYLEDNKNLPVAGEDVIVNFFDASKGKLSSFSATTDVNGHVAFNYTAPANIDSMSELDVTLKLAGDITNKNSVKIYFNTTVALKDYSNYTISLVDANRTITSSSQLEVFDVYLADHSSGITKAAEGETITVDFFNGTYGTMNSFSGVTDARGHVAFSYTAPVDLKDLNGTVITFRIKDTTDDAYKVTSVLSVSTDASLLSKLKVATSSITVNRDAEEKVVTILAYNGLGEAFDGGSVGVRYPDSITSGSVSGGQFTQNSVAIVNGKAIFHFIAPNPLVNIIPQNFTFVYSENSDINTTLTVNYIPEVPKIVINDGNITVTRNGEIEIIKLTVYDKDNSYYNGGNIKIKYPNEVLSGKDVGSFDTSSAPVVDGKAQFTYTAPNPLDGNGSVVFTFYHDSQPELSQKEFNVTMIPDSNQIVLTNYILKANYETSMPLETTKGMTFSIENEDGVRLNDSNITSITATVLNSALGSLEDTSGNKGSSLTVNNKNGVFINIKSKTLSGVIPVRVDTEFKDANNNDKNLTKVLNIVVLSGPPTAMSLSYAGTSQKSDYAKFVENWVLTVTDRYNNLVNTRPAISMGAIIGYAESSASTKNVAHYLYYDANASDGNLSNANPDTFKSAYDAFNNVDVTNDKLILFGGSGYRFNAFGKWDISSILSASKLELSDDYNGSDISGLGYAIGHNFRNERCSGSPVVANVYAKDGTNLLGSNGSMILQVEYDYYLVGKSVMLWTNLVGDDNGTSVKIGLSRKITLRGYTDVAGGSGLVGGSYDFAKGYKGIVRLLVTINGTVEYYKNANFGYAVEISGDGNTFKIIGSSMDQNITSCVDGNGNYSDGKAYVDVNITDSNSSGTLKLVNVIPGNEF